MEEIWKDIKGYEGYYQVSDLGRVKSLDRVVLKKNGISVFYPSKILQPTINAEGYRIVNLYKDGQRKLRRVAKLVTDTFIGSEELLTDHINRVRNDDKLKNLRKVTVEESNNNRVLKSGSTFYESSNLQPKDLIIKNLIELSLKYVSIDEIMKKTKEGCRDKKQKYYITKYLKSRFEH